MPRRRPQELRDRAIRRSPLYSGPGLPRGSGSLVGAVHRWERERGTPGQVALCLRIWTQMVRRPNFGHYRRGWWDVEYEVRETLEAVLRCLPPRAARELRDMVRPLDEIYLANTAADPFAEPDDRWWRRRL